MEVARNARMICWGKYLGKRPLGKPRRISKENSEMNLRVLCCRDARWIELNQDFVQWRALVPAVWNLQEVLKEC
jgi:hypothetical protein